MVLKAFGEGDRCLLASEPKPLLDIATLKRMRRHKHPLVVSAFPRVLNYPVLHGRADSSPPKIEIDKCDSFLLVDQSTHILHFKVALRACISWV